MFPAAVRRLGWERGDFLKAVDYFLKLDRIPGESEDAKHKGEIELENWSWGAVQQGTAGLGGGDGAGKVAMRDLVCNMRVHKGSPKLFLACARGDHLPTATLTCRKAGYEQQEYVVYKLYDVLVTSYRIKGAEEGGTVPGEEITLQYAKFEMQYREQAVDGSLLGTIKSGWDLKQNCAV